MLACSECPDGTERTARVALSFLLRVICASEEHPGFRPVKTRFVSYKGRDRREAGHGTIVSGNPGEKRRTAQPISAKQFYSGRDLVLGWHVCT